MSAFIAPTHIRRVWAGTRRCCCLAVVAVCGAGAVACGGAAEEDGISGGAQGAPPGACGDDVSCAPSQAVQRVPAGELACSVVSCPPGTDICCSAVSASATGNLDQSYVPRVQLVDSARSRFGEVRVEFTFDSADQQGWVTFEFGSELDLAWLSFTGWHEGVADRFMAVNTKRSADGGCAFSFDLERRGTPFPNQPFVFGSDVPFNTNNYCYGNGRPGRASELAFAIFSTAPGDATLVISNLALVGE